MRTSSVTFNFLRSILSSQHRQVCTPSGTAPASVTIDAAAWSVSGVKKCRCARCLSAPQCRCSGTGALCLTSHTAASSRDTRYLPLPLSCTCHRTRAAGGPISTIRRQVLAVSPVPLPGAAALLVSAVPLFLLLLAYRRPACHSVAASQSVSHRDSITAVMARDSTPALESSPCTPPTCSPRHRSTDWCHMAPRPPVT